MKPCSKKKKKSENGVKSWPLLICLLCKICLKAIESPLQPDETFRVEKNKSGGFSFTVGEGVCVIPLDMLLFFFVDLCISILYAGDTSAETCFWFYQPCRKKEWFRKKKWRGNERKKMLNIADCTQYLYINMTHASFENISCLFSLLRRNWILVINFSFFILIYCK